MRTIKILDEWNFYIWCSFMYVFLFQIWMLWDK